MTEQELRDEFEKRYGKIFNTANALTREGYSFAQTDEMWELFKSYSLAQETIVKLKEENEKLQVFINRFQDEFYLKNSSSGLMLLYKDIVEYDLKRSLGE